MHWIVSIILLLFSMSIYGYLHITVTDESGKKKAVPKPNLSNTRQTLFKAILLVSLTLALMLVFALWGLALECFFLAFYFLHKALSGNMKKLSRRLHWGYGITSAVLMTFFGIAAVQSRSHSAINVKPKSLAIVPTTTVDGKNGSTNATTVNSPSISTTPPSNTVGVSTSETTNKTVAPTTKSTIHTQTEDANYFSNKYEVNQPYDNVGYASDDNIIMIAIAPGQADKWLVDDIKNEILNNTGAYSLSGANGLPLAIDFFTDVKAAKIALESSPSDADNTYMAKHFYAQYMASDGSGKPVISILDMSSDEKTIDTMHVSK